MQAFAEEDKFLPVLYKTKGQTLHWDSKSTPTKGIVDGADLNDKTDRELKLKPENDMPDEELKLGSSGPSRWQRRQAIVLKQDTYAH